MIDPVPRHADITPDWINTLFARHGIAGTVIAVTKTPIGTGQVGSTFRFALSYAGGGASGPPSIVGKFHSDDPVSREAGRATLTYLREARFYTRLARAAALPPALPVPVALFVAFDEVTHAFAMIMHDLFAHYPGNQLREPLESEPVLAMTAAAAFHARWWGDASIEAEDWLIGSHAAPPPDNADATFAAMWPAFCDRYGDRVSPAARRVGEAFIGNVARWHGKFAGAPRTLIHNDYRSDNMLFQPRDEQQPIIIVDWQTPGVGCAAIDIGYYLGTAFPPADRREVYFELRDLWIERLIDLGVPAAQTADLPHLIPAAAFAGFQMGVTAAMIVGQTNRGDAMFLIMCERAAAMVCDYPDVALP